MVLNRSASTSGSSSGSGSSAVLSADELKNALSSLTGWHVDNTKGDSAEGALNASFRFGGFRAACGFMMQVWLLSERHDHHPIVRHNYRQVELWWRSHDVGGISSRDVAMAERCQKLAIQCHALI